MNKLKQLLFLRSIDGIGNAKINDNFLPILDESDDLDDLIASIEYKFKISLENLENAKIESEKLYDDIINDSEINVITVFDEDYPKKLRVMGNKKPLILFIKGNVNALKKSNIAIIGTRKPSKFSEFFEENLVKNIVNSTERVIVSGLALGCDKIAHQTTVDENKITVAVLPSGVNVIKPSSHKKLAEDIIKNGGCLVSEYNPNSDVTRGAYVERDRIVAAFSDATFVVECGIKSGTMHTVNFAKSFERQIYSFLPDEREQGTYEGNEFILQNYRNALRVENIDDVLEDLEKLNFKKESVQLTLF